MHRTALMAVVAALFVVALAACSATMHTAQGGSYVYARPRLESIEKTPLDQVWQAAQDAVADLEFTTKSAAKDSLQAKLVAEQADGTDVQIELKRLDEDATRVQIKVGAFGDQGVSELVLSKLRERIDNPMPESERTQVAEDVEDAEK